MDHVKEHFFGVWHSESKHYPYVSVGKSFWGSEPHSLFLC